VWNERRFSPEEDVFTVLLALPITFYESNKILKLVAAVAGRPGLEGVRFWIKPHPATNPKVTREKIGEGWPEKFHFVSSSFEECIEKSDLLISNTSSVCVEALAKGVPVIVIGNSSGLTQNPIPENVEGKIWKLCYTGKELFEAILFYLGCKFDAQEDFTRSGEIIRDAYFEKVTVNSVRDFLKLN
jgi:hypothetical protein